MGRETWLSLWNGREIREIQDGGNSCWSRGQQSGRGQPHAAGKSGRTSSGRTQSTGVQGVPRPREIRGQHLAQSPRILGTNSQAEERPELRVEERIFVGDQLNSAELQLLVCLLEARGQGLLRSARDGDEVRTGTNMRALLSALASGRAELDSMGQREGLSEEIKEEMMDRLQSMVRVALQKGDDLIMSSISYSWSNASRESLR